MPKPTSIIFIDADGPFFGIVTKSLWRDSEGISSDAIKLVNILAAKTNSNFVISSSKRRVPEEEKHEVIQEFVKAGFKMEFFHPTHPFTPDYTEPNTRIAEIREYLIRHPEIIRHVAVDDEILINDNTKPYVNSVLVDANLGFTIYDYNECCIKLGRSDLVVKDLAYRPDEKRARALQEISSHGLTK